jgi:hypothetical protein
MDPEKLRKKNILFVFLSFEAKAASCPNTYIFVIFKF